MPISKDLLRKLRPEIEAALAKIGEENGVSFHAGNASYSGNSGHFKLEISTVNDDGSVNTKAADDWTAMATLYGLDPALLGEWFEHGYDHKRYKIVGLNPKARKYPVSVVDESGKGYKFPVEIVKTYFAAKAAV